MIGKSFCLKKSNLKQKKASTISADRQKHRSELFHSYSRCDRSWSNQTYFRYECCAAWTDGPGIMRSLIPDKISKKCKSLEPLIQTEKPSSVHRFALSEDRSQWLSQPSAPYSQGYEWLLRHSHPALEPFPQGSYITSDQTNWQSTNETYFCY